MSFYKYPSTSVRQNEERGTTKPMQRWCVMVALFQSNLYVKMHVQTRFIIASTLTKNYIVLQRKFHVVEEKRRGKAVKITNETRGETEQVM